MHAYLVDRATGHMSHSLNSLTGVIYRGKMGKIYEIIVGVIKGDTRSLDYGSYVSIARGCQSTLVSSLCVGPGLLASASLVDTENDPFQFVYPWLEVSNRIAIYFPSALQLPFGYFCK